MIIDADGNRACRCEAYIQRLVTEIAIQNILAVELGILGDAIQFILQLLDFVLQGCPIADRVR